MWCCSIIIQLTAWVLTIVESIFAPKSRNLTWEPTTYSNSIEVTHVYVESSVCITKDTNTWQDLLVSNSTRQWLLANTKAHNRTQSYFPLVSYYSWVLKYTTVVTHEYLHLLVINRKYLSAQQGLLASIYNSTVITHEQCIPCVAWA